MGAGAITSHHDATVGGDSYCALTVSSGVRCDSDDECKGHRPASVRPDARAVALYKPRSLRLLCPIHVHSRLPLYIDFFCNTFLQRPFLLNALFHSPWRSNTTTATRTHPRTSRPSRSPCLTLLSARTSRTSVSCTLASDADVWLISLSTVLAQCARGQHQVTKKYGVCGIICAVCLFPIGLLCLLYVARWISPFP